MLSIVQNFKEEMVRVRSDNERLMQEQERILKIVSDKQNEGVLQPNLDRDMKEYNERETKDQTMDRIDRIPSQRINKNKNYNEAMSGNVSDQQQIKKKKSGATWWVLKNKTTYIR